jgi:hypothetical protein
MKKVLIIMLMISLVGIMFAQNLVTNGDFTAGTTGWTMTGTPAVNYWMVGNMPTHTYLNPATPPVGATHAAFVTNNGSSWTYTISDAGSKSYIYQSITFPPGAININLTFNWACWGESTFDYLKVFMFPAGHVPVAETGITGSGPASEPHQVGAERYNQINGWQSATINLPGGVYAGTTHVLAFEWRNDGSVGVGHPGAITNVSITHATAPPGPPPNVTLVSPANGAHVLSLTPTLTWTHGEGPSPTGYNVFVDITPAFSAAPYPVTGFATQFTIPTTLSEGISYFWRVTPYNDEGQPANTISRWFTVEDEVIQTFPHAENFDGVTAGAGVLPLGWTSFATPSMTGHNAEVFSFGSAHSSPNVLRLYMGNQDADLWVATRTVENLNGKRVKFFTRSTATGNSLQVGYLNESNQFVLIHTVQNLPTTAWTAEQILPMGNVPVGDFPIVFRHGGGGTYRTVYVDTVVIENLPAGANFHCLVTSINFGEFGMGSTSTISVPVSNLGAANLEITHPILPAGVTVNGFAQGHAAINVGPGSSLNLYYALTPTAQGAWNQTITINTNAANASTHAIAATAIIHPPGFAQIGNGTIDANIPIQHFYRHSFSQSIYTQADFSTVPVGAFIQQLSYQYNGITGTNGNPLNRAVRIWMGWTTQNTFPAASNFIPVNTLELVYEGMFNLTATGSPQWVGVELDGDGFAFLPPSAAHNLVICMNVYLENTAGWNTSANAYRSFATGVNRSLVYFVDGNTPINQNNPVGNSNNVIQNVPNLRINFDMAMVDYPSLSIIPDSAMPFGLVYIGLPIPDQSLRIRNNGNAPVTINSITITGTNATDWTLIDEPSAGHILASGEILPAITVSHHPTTAGAKTAAITITDSRGGPPTVIALTSQVQNLVLSSTDLPYLQNFDSVPVNTWPLGWGSYIAPGNTGEVAISTMRALSTPNGVRIASGNRQTAPVMFLSRPIDGLHLTRMRIHASALDTGNGFQVGYIENGNPASFELVETFTTMPTGTTAWEEYIVSFASAPNTGIRQIAITGVHHTNSRINYYDNFRLEIAPVGADFSCDTESIDFGYFEVGSTQTRPIRIQNYGTAELQLSIELPQYFSIGAETGTVQMNIPIGTTQTINITVAIPTIATINSSIDITTNATLVPTYSIPVTAGTALVESFGTGTLTGNQLPWSSGWHFTYSQSIYTPDDLPDLPEGATIRSIGYQFNGHTAIQRGLTIWIGYTTQTTLTGYLPIAGMTQVFSGNYVLPATAGWYSIALDGDGFDYDPPSPAHNLVIVTNVLSNPGDWLSAPSFFTTATTGNRSITNLTDTSPFNPATPPASPALRAFLPNIRIFYNETGLPRPRSLTGSGGLNVVNLNWLAPNIPPDSDLTLIGYSVYRNGSLRASGLEVTEFADDEVYHSIEYSYYVVANYEEGTSNPSNTFTVTIAGTHLDPPARLGFTSTGAMTGTLSWLPGDTILYESWEDSTFPTDWIRIDDDDDGHNWEIANFGGKEGNSHIRSSSFDGATPLFPHNWLISPEFFVPINGTFLNYWVGPISGSNRNEKYQVYISYPASTDINAFTHLTDVITLDSADWVRKSHSLNIAADNETPVRIAFVHIGHTALDRSGLKLDGISIVAPTTEPDYDFDLIGWRLYRNSAVLTNFINSVTFAQNVSHVTGLNQYWLTAIYQDGDTMMESYPSNIISMDTVSDGDIAIAPAQTRLGANYPNPFNPETVISFAIGGGEFAADAQHVTIEVYNIRGQRVKTLVDGMYATGEHTVVWNGTDDNGRSVSSGIYFYRMSSADYTATKKMILMK